MMMGLLIFWGVFVGIAAVFTLWAYTDYRKMNRKEQC